MIFWNLKESRSITISRHGAQYHQTFFLHLLHFFHFVLANLEGGGAFPTWSYMATSAATLIGRESHFHSHYNTVPVCLIDLTWSMCISLSLISQISVISEATTSVCAGGYSLQRKQAEAEVVGHTYHSFAWYTALSPGKECIFLIHPMTLQWF